MKLLLFALAAATTPRTTTDPPLPPALQDIGIVEKLGSQVPRELAFTDAQGHAVHLGDYLSEGRPVLLTLGYQRCPMLCNLVLTGVVRSITGTGLRAGTDFGLISVSIDPDETTKTAAQHQRGTLQSLGQGEDPRVWPFLTGGSREIATLADAVGFQYAYDPTTHQFAHDAAAFVLTPDGKVSRYLYGIDFNPRDLKWSLIEASGGRVGTSVDRVLLACYRWDPARRKYGLFARHILQGGGVLVMLGLTATLAMLWRRELRRLK